MLGFSSAQNAFANEIREPEITVGEGQISVEAAGMTLTNFYQTMGSSVVQSSSNHSITVGETSPNSLQLIIRIENEFSPKSFSFRINEAVGLEKVTSGAISVYRLVRQDNSEVAWLSEPWAKDAAGRELPTSFDFDEGIPTQEISTDSFVQYPVIADPYLWIDLIEYVAVTNLSTSKNLKVAVTPWLGAQYVPVAFNGYATGVLIAQNFGWSEVLDKVQSKYGLNMRIYFENRQTFKDQWDCHALGAPVIFVSTFSGFDTHPTWDLEGFRAPNSNPATWIATRCNW